MWRARARGQLVASSPAGRYAGGYPWRWHGGDIPALRRWPQYQSFTRRLAAARRALLEGTSLSLAALLEQLRHQAGPPGPVARGVRAIGRLGHGALEGRRGIATIWRWRPRRGAPPAARGPRARESRRAWSSAGPCRERRS